MSTLISETYDINIEAEGDELILQNVSNILRTVKGEMALNREFGISGLLIDKPIPKIQAKLKKEIIEQVNLHESGVNILSIAFESDINGIYPVLEVEIIE